MNKAAERLARRYGFEKSDVELFKKEKEKKPKTIDIEKRLAEEMLKRRKIKLDKPMPTIAKIATEQMAPSKGQKERKSAKANDYVLAFRKNKSKAKRTKLFFKLWFINLRDGSVTIVNIFWTVVNFPPAFIDDVVDALNETTEEKRKRNVKEMLKIVFKKADREKIDLKNIVMKNTKRALKRFVRVQILLSLLETILLLAFSNKSGNLRKEQLVNLALSVGVHGASRMNMDQLNLMIADELIKKA